MAASSALKPGVRKMAPSNPEWVRTLPNGKLPDRSDFVTYAHDWDARVKDRISKLSPTEIGYQKVNSIKINGKDQQLIEHETILEVRVMTDKIIRFRYAADGFFQKDFSYAVSKYFDEKLDYKKLLISSEPIVYKNFVFKKVLFCDGFQAAENPFFN